MTRNSWLILFFFFCFPILLSSQKTIPSKAQANYKKAESAYLLMNYDEALLYCHKAIKQDIFYEKPYLLMVDIYTQKNNKQQAVKIFDELILHNKNISSYFFLSAAKLAQECGFYEKMGIYLAQYNNCPEKSEEDASLAKLLQNSYDFVMNAIANPLPFEPENLGEAINSSDAEYFPCMTLDGKSMIFTRRIKNPLAKTMNNEQEDLFVSYFQNDAWAKAIPMDNTINSPNNEGASTLSIDGRILIFTVCADIERTYNNGREGYGSCDLFYSVKEQSMWGQSQNLGSDINTSQWESMPSLSADGKSLYFIRGDRTLHNSGDIYVSYLQQDNRWGKPIKLPDNINSSGQEHSVFIHPDGKTLYFSSNGHPGMGGFDLFITRKINDSTWSNPENLGYPINTCSDETSILLSADGQYAYFAAERPEGFGKTDIYRFKTPSHIYPVPTMCIYGKTFDVNTLQPLTAKLELIDMQKNEKVLQSYSEKQQGNFFIAAPMDKIYALNASAPGYLLYSDIIKLTQKPLLNEVYKEIALQKIEIGVSTVLKNIFFDFDKSELQSKSQTELIRLAEFLQMNPDIHIEIEGHTDNQGEKAYNQQLSEARAKAVFNYLVSLNISADRMTYKGYGDTQPCASNEDETGRSLNRRTAYKIIQK